MDLQAIVLAHEREFRIGGVEVRPATRELVIGTRHALLEPRVMQMLVALHRAGGSVVTKDELIGLCWNGRIVGEDAINRVVSRLRAAARDHADGEFRIETITRVGYRLAERTGDEQGPDAPTADQVGHLSPQPRSPSRRAVLIAAGAAFLTGGGVIGMDLVRRDRLRGEARTFAEEARRAFLLGDRDGDANAVGMLREAASLQPENAEVWGLLALGYMRMLRSAAAEDRNALRQRGEAAAQRALELDAEQPDAKAALLIVRPLFRNWVAFDRASAQLYQSHPEHLDLCIQRARLLAQVGRYAEILAPTRKAAQRAPAHSSVQLWYARILVETGRLEEGEAQLERCFSLWPRRLDIFFQRLNHLLYHHRAEEALGLLRRRGGLPTSLEPEEIELAELKASAIVSGRSDQVGTALDRLEAVAGEATWLAEDAVVFAVNRGDLDRAFRILSALYFNRGFAVADTVQSSAGGRERNTHFLFWRVMRPLRRDPRFDRLTRMLGLDDYWQRSGTRQLVTA